MDGHLVRVRDDGLQVPEDLALGQHRPILGIQHIKPVWAIDVIVSSCAWQWMSSSSRSTTHRTVRA